MNNENVSGSRDPAEPRGNEYAPPFGLNISFPETIRIRMVDASALSDYEVLIFFTGVFSNIASGFLVTLAISDTKSTILIVNSLVFAMLTVAFLVWALAKRSSMTKRAKDLKIKGSSVKEIVG